MQRKKTFTIITICLSLIICIGLGELMARLFVPKKITLDERNVLYRYDEKLGWFPIENKSAQYEGSHVINVKNSKLGFRDIDHGAKTKKRIAFLGDSFVWGYDVEQSERFTEKLRTQLSNYDIINMGVSGYGNDQSLILIEKWFDHFQPDIVILVFCDNDFGNNTDNIVHNGYHKPYFKTVNNQLKECGTPVPKSINYYYSKYPVILESRLVQIIFRLLQPHHVSIEDPTEKIFGRMNDYVRSKGAKFYVAFVDQTFEKKKQALCDPNGVEYLWLNSDFKYKAFGQHWTPEGHTVASQKIFNFMSRQDLLE